MNQRDSPPRRDPRFPLVGGASVAFRGSCRPGRDVAVRPLGHDAGSSRGGRSGRPLRADSPRSGTAARSRTSTDPRTVSDAAAGSYQLSVKRLVSTQQYLTRGFANKDSAAVGLTSLSFETGGGSVSSETALSDLNGFAGVERGKIQIKDAIQALFTLAYGIKFGLKKRGDRRPFPPMHLEGLYWVPGQEGCALTDLDITPGAMHWTLMIAVPSFVTARLLDTARAEAAPKHALPALPLVRCDRLAEGAAAQVLHIGPYDAEGPTLERLFAFIAAAGGTPRGRHHEIYLNDPRRVGPAKTKTILRQPFRPS